MPVPAGTSYRQQRDDILTARALELRAEGVGSEEIAYALGFSDASAFRRWSGRSPASHPAGRARAAVA